MHWLGLPSTVCFTHLHDRITDSDRRVLYDSVRRLMDRNCFGVKRLLQKVDHFRCADGMEIWHQIRDTFGNVAWSGSGRDVPVISADVLDSSAALTILHFHRRHQRDPPGPHRPVLNRITVPTTT